MRRSRPTVARPSPLGFVVSLLFHLLIAAAALIAFRHTFDAAPETHAVPVDLVTLADRTNVRAEAPPQPKPEKPIPAANEPPPLPQFQETEPSPDITMPKFKVRPETKKETLQDADALLNKLFTAPKAPPKNAKAGPRTITGIGAMNGMTADLADALKSQIYRCWSPPVGAPDANDLVTDFDLMLNPDGTVASLKPSMSTAMASAGNPYTRAAADAARRAIATCAPYKMPTDRYAQWRDVSPLRFDPREAMRQ
jgi:outer membrane biosynthesis protein TonB